MFVEFYGLHEDPFGLFTQRYLYLSASHRKALSSLQYGIEYGGGAQLLLGGGGLGKTTLLRYLEARQQAHKRIAYLDSAHAKDPDLVKGFTIAPIVQAGENGAGQPADGAAAPEKEAKERLVMLVDDAHELNHQELARLLALAKRGAAEKDGFHFILAGRPELLQKLKQANASDTIEQIWLNPLGAGETEGYINYRLHMAAGRRGAIFTAAACALIARQSEGVPRAINHICAEALRTGAERQLKLIDMSVFDTHELAAANGTARVSPQAAQPSPATPPRSHKAPTASVLLAALLLATTAALGYEEWPRLYRTYIADVNSGLSVSKPLPAEAARSIAPSSLSKSAKIEPVAKIQSSNSSAAVEIKNTALPTSSVITSRPPEISSGHDRERTAAEAKADSISSAARTLPRDARRNVSVIAPAESMHSSTPSALPPSEVRRDRTNGQFAEAAAQAHSANPLGIVDEHQAHIYSAVGDDYMRLGKYDDAIAFYRYALALAPGDARIQEKMNRAALKAAGDE
ncbi:MAG TPA: AAA family ATPase [Candidatus Binataceae bacterium]|nr:AAA family ATPase [Candidatus Binataceae bacterium]